MFKMRYALESDSHNWFKFDKYIRKEEFSLKARDKRAYFICDDDKIVGVLRYNLFWDEIPFLTLIHLKENYQRKSFGKKAMIYWQNEMRALGYKMVMTSTQADDDAQHFYRKLGYKDRGSLFFDGTPHDQPAELFMIKVL